MKAEADGRALAARRPALFVGLAMALVALVPLIGGLVFFNRANKLVEKQERQLAGEYVALAVRRADTVLSDLASMSYSLKSELRGVVLPPYAQLTTNDRLNINALRGTLSSAAKSVNTSVSCLYVYDAGADYCVSGNAMVFPELIYKSCYGGVKQDLNRLHTERSVGRLTKMEGGLLAYTYTLARDLNTGAAARQLIALIKADYFPTLLRQISGTDINYALRDEKGDTIFTFAPQEETADRIEIELPLSYAGYTLTASVAPLSESGSGFLRGLYLSLLGVSLTILAALCMLLPKRAVKPMSDLIDDYRETLAESRAAILLKGLTVGGVRAAEGDCAVICFDDSPQASFPCEKEEQRPALLDALSSLKNEGYDGSAAWVDGALSLLLTRTEGDLNAAAVAERLLDYMEEKHTWSAVAAVSGEHADGGIEDACREARMALETLYWQEELPVVRYDAIAYHPELILRDYKHLDKQLAFASAAGEGDWEEALDRLPELFPVEYEDTRARETSMSALHLSSLKYQFIHDLDSLIPISARDAGDLRREAVSAILGCKNHTELHQLIQKQLSDAAGGKTDDSEAGASPDEVKSYIRAHSSDPALSVSSVAERFRVTPGALSKRFARKTGMGVLQYIHKVRIESACNLLLSDDAPIAEIAARVGYVSALTFTRAFKARYKMTPGEYRKETRERADSEKN